MKQLIFSFTMIYLVRHGQTKWNLEQRRQGKLNSDLTDLGIQQAQAVADYISSLKIDKIYCSNLGRTVQTAKIIIDKIKTKSKVEIEYTHFLQEIDHGAWDGILKSEIPKEKLNLPNIQTKYEGGESVANVADRLKVFLKKLDIINQDILIIAHNTCNRIFRTILLDIQLESYDFFTQDNNQIIIINPITKQEKLILCQRN